MPVYVDDLLPVDTYRAGAFGRQWRYACHLVADTGAELDDIRKRLNLHPSWRHGDHYDLTSNKRRLAIKHGAVAVTTREMVRIRKQQRTIPKPKGPRGCEHPPYG